MSDLEKTINWLWDNKGNLEKTEVLKYKSDVEEAIDLLNKGDLRVAEKKSSCNWVINEWLKKAILLSFGLFENKLIEGAPDKSFWYDKVDSKFVGWSELDFKASEIRAVPLAYVRKSAFIGKGAILMPSFVNVGGYVGERTMIDTWASVGSCAQVGKNCHISAGVNLGGVLEPLQASPVIIEDNCFIGAGSQIVEGVVVGEGSVIAMGVYISKSTKIVNRETGEISYGMVPPYSVVVSGSLPNEDMGKPSLYCAVIIKQVDEGTRAKTSVNDLLRD